MKKTIVLIIILNLFSCIKKKEEFNLSKSNKDSLDYYTNILISSDFSQKKKKPYINKLLLFHKNLTNIKKNRDSNSKLVFYFYSNNDFENLDAFSRILLKNSLKANDSINLGVAYRSRAYYNKTQNLFDSTFYYYLKAEKIYRALEDMENYPKVLFNKGLVEISTNDYLAAEYSLSKAYSLFKKNNNKRNVYETLVELGLVYLELKEYDIAISKYEESLKIIEDSDFEDKNIQLSICYNNFGYTYLIQKEYKKAEQFFKKALKTDNLLIDSPEIYAMLIDNYAYSKLKTNQLNELPNLFYVSLKIRDDNNLNSGIVLNKIHLSEYYFLINDEVKAKKNAEEALTLSKSTKVYSDILNSLKQLSVVDKKSTVYYKQYIHLSDSLQLEERKSKDRFARIQLETDEVIQKNTELEEINRYLVVFAFGLFSIFALLYAVRAQKMKNRELAFKQEQQENNRQIYNLMITQQEKVDATSAYEKNKMAQELHDGILSKMFGTRMNLDSLNDSKDEASITMRYNYIQELKSIEQEIREISHDLSSVKGKIINNFVNIVIDLLEEQKKSFTATLVYTIDKEISWDKLDNTAKINMYRILQESLQNSNKYANAKSIIVSFTQIDATVVLKIEDDGIGFDLNKKKKGIGLKNMISRTEESKGIYEIISEQGKGTITNVTIPLNQQKPTQIA